MRRALVIAHPFPPSGGGGVQRSAKLVKYLPAFGWKATVLTTQEDLYSRATGIEDRTLLAEVEPLAEIVRVRSPEAIELPKPVGRWVRRVALPDKSVVWNPGALAAGIGLHARRQFQIVYATANPYSSFLLARDLARVIRRPYVLDMRDAWRLRGNRRPGHPLNEMRLANMERLVLDEAAHVIFATAPMEERYLQYYPRLKGRTSTIINGFDLEDYPPMPNPRPLSGPDDPVVFFHSGTWNDYVRPHALLDGFRRAREVDPEFRARARLEMVGQWGTRPEDRVTLDALVDKHGLREIFAHHGYKPHPETVLRQRTADVLLLVTSGLPDEQQAKTAEYVASGRPVVALVDGGVPAEQLIDRAALVEKAPPHDPIGAARALLAAFREADDRRVGPILPDPPPSALDLTRRYAAGRVADIFGALTQDAARATSR